MILVSDKIKLTVLGVILFPCFARINLNGTNFEYDIYRYFVPFIFGGLSGYLIGLTEEYIQKHSDVEFSHGICPECSDKLYGRYDWYKKKHKI